ncbi:MAG: hypothetical protein ACXVA9_05905 [Bdellovibrionales bacterium]
MEPRLSTSRKWTPLPEELVKQIRSVFKQNFKAQIGTGSIEANGKIFPEEIMVSVGFREKDALKQSNWEISIGYKRNKDNVLKLLHTAIDAAASLFEQFFAAENDEDFPRKWEEVDFEGRKIYVQYNTANSSLEAEANRLLGESDENDLVQGAWDDETEDISPDDIKKKLGVDDEDGDDDGGKAH